MFWHSKVERVLIPTLRLMLARTRQINPHVVVVDWHAEWRAYLRSALFCCPLLTKNLLDFTAYPIEIALLGLSQAVEMAAESSGVRSFVDESLDLAAQQVP